MEIIVLKDTILTEREVSPPNFEENIVVMAAVGAEAEMVIATKTSPLIPQTYIPNNVARGKIKSFKTIDGKRETTEWVCKILVNCLGILA